MDLIVHDATLNRLKGGGHDAGNDPVEVTRCFFDKREGNRPTKRNKYSKSIQGTKVAYHNNIYIYIWVCLKKMKSLCCLEGETSSLDSEAAMAIDQIRQIDSSPSHETSTSPSEPLANSTTMAPSMSLLSVNAILILNSDDGSRVFAKYYSTPHHASGPTHTQSSMPLLSSPPVPLPPLPTPSILY
jgi:hypothetical protein